MPWFTFYQRHIVVLKPIRTLFRWSLSLLFLRSFLLNDSSCVAVSRTNTGEIKHMISVKSMSIHVKKNLIVMKNEVLDKKVKCWLLKKLLIIRRKKKKNLLMLPI